MNNISYKLEQAKFYDGMCVTEYLNGRPNNFWSVDSLISPQGYGVESYKNDKIWLQRNHPELII